MINICVVKVVTSLLQCKPPLEVNDLFEDIKDGVKLLALLEVLSGQRLVSSTIDYFCPGEKYELTGRLTYTSKMLNLPFVLDDSTLEH